MRCLSGKLSIKISRVTQLTYVSQMQALGVDLATIQSIVGHADIDMTKHYLHVQESIRQAAIEKFSEAFTVEEEQMRNSSHLSLVKSS